MAERTLRWWSIFFYPGSIAENPYLRCHANIAYSLTYEIPLAIDNGTACTLCIDLSLSCLVVAGEENSLKTAARVETAPSGKASVRN